MAKLLEVENLRIAFESRGEANEVVGGINFSVSSDGHTVAILGESGSGKSVTCLALTRLLPAEPTCTVGGSIRFEGKEVLQMQPEEVRRLRGEGIAYIFQEPSASLNPVFTVGSQIAEAVKQHRPDIDDVRGRVVELLQLVGIRDAAQRFSAYPHEMSGGMQQRVMIAMALACEPKLLVADEPTTALDVTIQAQIMELLRDLRAKLGMSIVLITHNFGIVKGFADEVLVMYRGQIVEQGPVEQVLENPRHPYTKALIACIPKIGSKQKRLTTIGQEMELAQPKVRMEDEVEDVLGKAMRGLGLSPAALAERARVSAEQVGAALHGELDPTVLAPLARALGLGEKALLELADGGSGPSIELPERLAMLNTPHPVPGYAEMTVNSYLLLPEAESSTAIAFDTGSDAAQHHRLFSKTGRKLSQLFLTHTHGDHVAAYEELIESPIPVMTPEHEPYGEAEPVRHGQVFDLAGYRIEARETSGHSPGGMTYRIEGLGVPVALVGDAIFCRSMGKVPADRYRAAMQMIETEILSLPDETILCPGHGPLTTVGFEKQHNPFFTAEQKQGANSSG